MIYLSGWLSSSKKNSLKFFFYLSTILFHLPFGYRYWRLEMKPTKNQEKKS